MVDILLSSDDLAVLGGPETVNVEVDFGAAGDRGSQIFTNLGKPTNVLAPNAQLFDLYINILSTDDEYQYVYQLQNVLGTDTWVKLFKLVSNIYSRNYTIPDFVDGVWDKNIPVIDIVPTDFVGTVTASNFNIQYSILNQNPIASSLTVNEIETSGGALVLPISINAVELDGATWQNLSGPKTVHLFITMV